MVMIGVTVWLVSGYAHVVMLLSVVVFTLPHCSVTGGTLGVDVICWGVLTHF